MSSIASSVTCTFCFPLCADTSLSKWVVFVVAAAAGIFSGLTVLGFSTDILIPILKIHSADGRREASSTCSAHWTAMSILYGPLLFIYVQPSACVSLGLDKVVSVVYTAGIPMLNPFTYSLRNKEVKDAIHRAVFKRTFSRA